MATIYKTIYVTERREKGSPHSEWLYLATYLTPEGANLALDPMFCSNRYYYRVAPLTRFYNA